MLQAVATSFVTGRFDVVSRQKFHAVQFLLRTDPSSPVLQLERPKALTYIETFGKVIAVPLAFAS
jgi:hypothetical protein